MTEADWFDTDTSAEAEADAKTVGETKADDDASGEAKEILGPLTLANATAVRGPLKAAVIVTD